MKKKVTLLAAMFLAAIVLLHRNYFDQKEKKAFIVANGTSTLSNGIASSSNNVLSSKKRLYRANLLKKEGTASLYNFTNAMSGCTNAPNDPGFPYQWGLYNAQNPNIDINMCEAWDLSQGIGIKVAVIDFKIDDQEADLAPNLLPISNTVTPYPSSINSTHGTDVAGIIGAVKNNGVKTAGVAPDSKIMAISADLGYLGNLQLSLAQGIDWAVNQGAQVINLSWGFDAGDPGNLNYYGNYINIAVDNAINQGVVVVQASGNSDVIKYPASVVPEIIVVGSIDKNGIRVNGQNGNKSAYISPNANHPKLLDVVAPGLDYPLLSSQITEDGYIGSADGGTSYAAPHVAGVAALMLSVNPDLSVKRVHDIINETAQEINDNIYDYTTGWDDEVGHGLLDAYEAVKKAKEEKDTLRISNNINLVCSNSTYKFTVNNYIDNVVWQVSTNLDIISSNNHEIVVKGKSYTTISGGYGFVKASIGADMDQHNFWVGTPQPGIIQFSNHLGGTTHLCSSHNNNTYSFTTTPVNIDNHQVRLKTFPGMNVVYTSPIRTGKMGTINYPATPGWYVLEVRLTNACGTSDWVGQEVQYIDCTVGGGGGPGGGGPGGEGGENGGMNRNSNISLDQDSNTRYLFSIYPNPTSSIVSIKRKPTVQKNTIKPVSGNYELYSLNGKLLRKGVLKEGSTINVANIKKGMYILKLYSDGTSETHRVMIN